MRRCRVLLTTDAVGGVWQYSVDLARGYTRRGLAVDLVLLGPPPSPMRLAELRGISGVEVIPTGLPLDWMAEDEPSVRLAACDLAELAGRRRADLIHLNCAGLGCTGDWLAPVVTTLHSCVATWWSAVKGPQPLPEDFSWRRDLVAAALRQMDAVIVPSRAFAIAMSGVYPQPAELFVVHNGRDDYSDGELAAVDSDAVFTCGRLWDEGKNVAAIDAAAGLLGLPIRAAGSVVAPHGGAVSLRYLDLLGELSGSEIRQQLRKTGVFVSVAHYEPFGLGVLEAAQQGSALVLSDIPTFRELWRDAARFVDPRRPDELARAIGTLTNAPQLRAELGRRARQRANRFTCEKMTDSTLSVYRQVLRRQNTRVGAA